MARHTFPSLLDPRVGYTLHADGMALWHEAYRTPRALGSACGVFDTYGDGMTQHSPECAVTASRCADYCASLASYLLSLAPDSDDAHDAAYAASRAMDRGRVSDRTVRFALSVEYDEKKRRYYTLAGFDGARVSSRESYRHDKRWHEVKECHDGTPSGAYAVICDAEASGSHYVLERLALRLQCSEAWDSSEGDQWVARLLGLDESAQWDSEQYRERDRAMSALRLLRTTVDSMESRRHARRSLECWRENHARKGETEAA